MGQSNDGSSNTSDEPSTVIIGAGIIGCATAYYLSQSSSFKPGTVHLVESSSELFASASGKSGGFLASDWFGPPAASLGKLSFQLHKQLAEQHDGLKNWGYSRSTGTSLVTDTSSNGARGEDWLFSGGSRSEVAGVHEFKGDQIGPAWLTRQKGDQIELIGEDGGVAQVDPLRLCHFLLNQSLSGGVQLHQPAEVLRITQDPNTGTLSGLHIRDAHGGDTHIACSRLVLAAGAWTPRVFATLFPSARATTIPISPLAGHSLVVRSPKWTAADEPSGCHAVFTTTAAGLSPEIFSRVGAEIYVAGLNDAALPLPARATDAVVDPACIAQLRGVAQRFVGGDNAAAGAAGAAEEVEKAGDGSSGQLEVLREGLCFRPVTRRGFPIIARVRDSALGGVATVPSPRGGVFVAAGHGPWGISHSLGTGKVVAEMVEGRQLSAEIGGLGL